MSNTSKIDWTNATWNPIPNMVGYEVSDTGQIRRSLPGKSTRIGRILQLQRSRNGYFYVMIRRKKLWVHTAVLTAFISPKPPEQECRHLDGNASNNKLSNLTWGTDLENAADKIRHGTQLQGEMHPSAKLTETLVRELRARIGTRTLRALAAEYGISHTAIRRAAKGITWSHVQ